MSKRNRTFRVIISALRHRWLVYFRPRYTIQSLMKRRGKCLNCGRCCLINTPWCRYLKAGHCQIYIRQPFFCKVFPIDQKDKQMSGVAEECGYFWEDR